MNSKQTNQGSWAKTRKFFNDVHLWLGLISGLILLVVCFTGTIYVYHNEIREMGAPHLYNVKALPGKARLTIDEVLETLKSKIPGDLTAVQVPHDPKRTLQLSIREQNDNSRGGTTYFVNPYTAEVLGTSKDPNRANEWLRTMFSLHRWLMLDRIENPIIGELPNRTLGSYITGAATILFTLGVLTGIVIWVPRKVKNWKQGLKVKFGGSWKRTNHDLHNTLAFYSAIVLFIMGVTGPFWSFPWYREGLQKSLGTYQEAPAGGRPGGRSEKSSNDSPQAPLLSLNAYLAEADKHLPYPGDYRINFPRPGAAEISLTKSKVGFFAPAAADRITLQTSDAGLKSLDLFSDKPFNERVSASIKALHMGDVYGGFSKIIYFISCLIATSLPITGTLIWINKMKKKKPRTKTRSPKKGNSETAPDSHPTWRRAAGVH
ncbi:MAG: PepSY domain-containing protein [Lunatimonas sp.]|uniref:PepSY-associated TM helix domain-containing protein n=1 Tax=Lunatimonas sp. TaxID=2060141 RepID=UPI00263A6A57|nr:PepSY-associated TM helix domain-containing protein [Lunatimonas sp.]MCC5939770.1 PepSY domain-containing protein [Lunatimonas sp.]